ncbi:MAG: PaaI family thioesterase [Rhodospirillales bacterium]|nr:PaaI family thioesterase [Rhodospirillales bacterium]
MSKNDSTPLAHLADIPSGFRQLIGFRLTEWKQGEATLSLTVGPRHLNRNGVVHGGVLTTLIDAAGGYAGCYCPHPNRVRRTATVSLATQFIAPGRNGEIVARARVRGGGRRIFISSVEVLDAGGKLLALGEGVYRYSSGSEKPDGTPVERKGETRGTDLG